MKKLLTILMFLSIVFSIKADGVSVSIENDIFGRSDNNYSHATEIKYNTQYPQDNVFLTSLGIRQFFYTPDDITKGVVIQPYERAYCGVFVGFYQMWRKESTFIGDEYTLYEFDFGVMGPMALGGETQSYVHGLLPGNSQPIGWNNQVPNEPILNGYMERHHKLVTLGKSDSWETKINTIYGGCLGTTWVNSFVGAEMKIGYNVPDFVSDNTFSMKTANGNIVINNKFYSYIKLESRRVGQILNSTLGDSLFRDHPYGRTLQPFYYENTMGLVIGYGKFSICYLLTERSDEFKGQAKSMDYGTLMLNFGTTF
jgi:lipid A 3-O-deacylase